MIATLLTGSFGASPVYTVTLSNHPHTNAVMGAIGKHHSLCPVLPVRTYSINSPAVSRQEFSQHLLLPLPLLEKVKHVKTIYYGP